MEQVSMYLTPFPFQVNEALKSSWLWLADVLDTYPTMCDSNIMKYVSLQE